MSQRTFSRRQLRAALGLVTASALASIFPAQAQTGSTYPAPQQLGNQPGSMSPGMGSSNVTPAASTGGATVSPIDIALMQELAQANLSEMALGRLALAKSANPQIRAFAERQVSESGRSEYQLQQIAQIKGVQLPSVPNATNQALEQRLSAMSGPSFDRTYLDHVSMADQRQLLSRISSGASDADLKALAGSGLPAVDAQLQIAEYLRAGSSSTSTGASGATGATGSGSAPRPSSPGSY